MPDQRQRFLFEHFAVRGEVVQLNNSLKEMFANHQYPEPIKNLLGAFMSAAALLSATIKFEGSLILQVKGNGQVSTLMAECRNQTSLRAIAQYSENFSADDPLLGKGQMAITIEPKQGKRYQGIVLIEDNGLANALQDYFLQSEQLRTKIWLAASNATAAGLLLQSMPENASTSSLNIESEDWDRVSMLADTIKDDELLDLPIDDILHRLYNEEDLRLFEPSTLEFSCNCSTERSENALLSMGETETRTLLAERGQPIEIDCQFCHAKYRFDEPALNRLFNTQVH